MLLCHIVCCMLHCVTHRLEITVPIGLALNTDNYLVSLFTVVYCYSLHVTVSVSALCCMECDNLHVHIEGFRPEWHILTTIISIYIYLICSRDIPFWSETLDTFHGLLCYCVTVCGVTVCCVMVCCVTVCVCNGLLYNSLWCNSLCV